MDLTIRRHRAIDAGLTERWLRLAERCGAGVFSTPQWCSAWLATIGSSVQPLIIEANRGDDTVAIMPLCVVRHAATTWLEMTGADGAAGDALDVIGSTRLTTDELDWLIGRVINGDELGEGESRFDGLRLANLSDASPFASRVERFATARGLAVHTHQLQCRPCIGLPETFDEYLATLSANMRYHVRRRRREAVRSGAVIRRIDSESELQAFLDSFFDLHAARWKSNGGGGFSDASKQVFLRRFCRDALDCGWLRALALAVDRETIGVLIAFHFGDRCNYYQMGWRGDMRVASPGVVLLAASIEAAIEDRLAVYDFLQGDEAYKSRWMHRSETQRTLWIGKSMAARAVISAARIMRSFKHAFARLSGAGQNSEAVRVTDEAGARP